MSIMKKLDVSLECGDLSPLLVQRHALRKHQRAPREYQSADKSAHSREAPED